MNRRDILKTIFALGVQSLLPFPWSEAEAAVRTDPKLGRLNIYNEHTGEHLNVCYLDGGRSLDERSYHELTRFFRCTYDGTIHPIDPRLFVLLDCVHCLLGAKGRPFRLVSGYRSPAYNRLLCSEESGVARNSFHIKGMAADVYIEGVSLRDIETAGKRLNIGGVGNYSDFVHLDVGPPRRW